MSIESFFRVKLHRYVGKFRLNLQLEREKRLSMDSGIFDSKLPDVFMRFIPNPFITAINFFLHACTLRHSPRVSHRTPDNPIERTSNRYLRLSSYPGKIPDRDRDAVWPIITLVYRMIYQARSYRSLSETSGVERGRRRRDKLSVHRKGERKRHVGLRLHLFQR